MACGQPICTWGDLAWLVGGIAVAAWAIVQTHLDDRGLSWRELGRRYGATWRRRLGVRPAAPRRARAAPGFLERVAAPYWRLAAVLVVLVLVVDRALQI